MKIKYLKLENFKRFTNLEIRDIPVSSKLVLLIGSNGSGKSSIFDAFALIDSSIKKDYGRLKENWDYFQKDEKKELSINLVLNNQENINLSKSTLGRTNLPVNTFYGRTSFRQVSRLTRTSLGQGGSVDFEKDSDRPRFFIDKDARFENDIEKITEIILNELFRGNSSNEEIKNKFIKPINIALENIFGYQNGTKLELIEIIPPLEGKIARITFRKGESEIHYNLLSAGEKEVINILFNLLSRKDYYQDTIYFFDEIDLHLSTKLQFNLLKEITENWVPENSQLWTASHSLGFIDYAKDYEFASIFDFDDLDFDKNQILKPVLKSNTQMFEIAVNRDILEKLYKDKNIIFVENKDKEFFANLNLEDTLFVSGNNKHDVFHKCNNLNYKGIIDRDYLSDDDLLVIKKNYPNLIILDYYCIENYLYHPENLIELNSEFDSNSYIKYLINEKNQNKDDLKIRISSDRESYPFFKDTKYNKSNLQNRFKRKDENFYQTKVIYSYLDRNELEIFFKSYSLKNYGKNNTLRHSINKNQFSKTKWFREKMLKLIN